jgi:hypothetical protein
LQHATATLTSHGVPASAAAGQAFGLIGQAVTQQATMLAYIDVFFGYAVLAAVLAPIAFFLLRPAPGGQASAAR